MEINKSCSVASIANLEAQLALLQEDEVRQASLSKQKISSDLVAAELYATYMAATDNRHYPSAVRALELLGKHLGMFDNKAPHNDENAPRAILYTPDNQRLNSIVDGSNTST